MQTSAGTFAGSVEVMYGALSVTVDLDTAALIMSRGTYGYHVAGYVYTYAETFGVDGWKSLDKMFFANAACIEVEVIFAAEFHLVVDGACHNVAWCQRETFVVFLHKLLSFTVL